VADRVSENVSGSMAPNVSGLTDIYLDRHPYIYMTMHCPGCQHALYFHVHRGGSGDSPERIVKGYCPNEKSLCQFAGYLFAIDRLTGRLESYERI